MGGESKLFEGPLFKKTRKRLSALTGWKRYYAVLTKSHFKLYHSPSCDSPPKESINLAKLDSIMWFKKKNNGTWFELKWIAESGDKEAEGGFKIMTLQATSKDDAGYWVQMVIDARKKVLGSAATAIDSKEAAAAAAAALSPGGSGSDDEVKSLASVGSAPSGSSALSARDDKGSDRIASTGHKKSYLDAESIDGMKPPTIAELRTAKSAGIPASYAAHKRNMTLASAAVSALKSAEGKDEMVLEFDSDEDEKADIKRKFRVKRKKRKSIDGNDMANLESRYRGIGSIKTPYLYRRRSFPYNGDPFVEVIFQDTEFLFMGAHPYLGTVSPFRRAIWNVIESASEIPLEVSRTVLFTVPDDIDLLQLLEQQFVYLAAGMSDMFINKASDVIQQIFATRCPQLMECLGVLFMESASLPSALQGSPSAMKELEYNTTICQAMAIRLAWQILQYESSNRTQEILAASDAEMKGTVKESKPDDYLCDHFAETIEIWFQPTKLSRLQQEVFLEGVFRILLGMQDESASHHESRTGRDGSTRDMGSRSENEDGSSHGGASVTGGSSFSLGTSAGSHHEEESLKRKTSFEMAKTPTSFKKSKGVPKITVDELNRTSPGGRSGSLQTSPKISGSTMKKPEFGLNSMAFLGNLVRNTEAWKALFIVLRHRKTDSKLLNEALRNVNAMLVGSWENVASLLTWEQKWSAWLIPVLNIPSLDQLIEDAKSMKVTLDAAVRVSKAVALDSTYLDDMNLLAEVKGRSRDDSTKAALLRQENVLLCLNVLSSVLFQAFFRSSTFCDITRYCIRHLYLFGVSTDTGSESLIMCKIMLESLIRRISVKQYRTFFSSSMEDIAWSNLSLLCKVIREFVFRTSLWEDSSIDYGYFEENFLPGAAVVKKKIPDGAEYGIHWIESAQSADLSLVECLYHLLKSVMLSPEQLSKVSDKEIYREILAEHSFIEAAPVFLEALQEKVASVSRDDQSALVRKFCTAKFSQKTLTEIVTEVSTSLGSMVGSEDYVALMKERSVATRKISVETLTKQLTKRAESLNIDEIKTKLIANVKVRDRYFQVKSFKKCFVGSEAVKYMVASGVALNPKHAVLIGTLLINAGAIRCVSHADKVFVDGEYFYRFSEHEEIGSKVRSSSSEDAKSPLTGRKGLASRVSGAEGALGKITEDT